MLKLSLTAAGIGAIGDVSAQSVERRYLFPRAPPREDDAATTSQGGGPSTGASRSLTLDSWDAARTGRLVAFRVVQGPVVEALWRLLDARYAALPPARRVAAKVLTDQLVFMPPGTFLFFCSQALLDGTLAFSRAVAVLPTAIALQWPYWMAAHTVTFGLVPARLRVAWFSAAAVVANGYLSFLNAHSYSIGGGGDALLGDLGRAFWANFSSSREGGGGGGPVSGSVVRPSSAHTPALCPAVQPVPTAFSAVGTTATKPAGGARPQGAVVVAARDVV